MDIPLGLTFDDVLLVPQFSSINSRNDVDLKTRLSKNIILNIPIISSNMDTVTEDKMAIGMAQNGGIGIIHRYCTIEDEAMMVQKVKRAESYIIRDPYTAKKNETIMDIIDKISMTGILTYLIVDAENKLEGILTNRDIKSAGLYALVEKYMTPIRDTIISYNSEITMDEAKRMMHDNRVQKLPLIDKNYKVMGLICMKDIERIQRRPMANLDSRGRLKCGAAVGVKDTIKRAKKLVEADVDILCIDIAHGHSELCINALKQIKDNFNVDVICGNVATKEGALDLIKAGADAIKVGIGGGCFAAETKILMGDNTQKSIEHINIGDEVINMYGLPIKVINTFMTGIKRVIEIQTDYSERKTYVTPDHKFLVMEDDNFVFRSIIECQKILSFGNKTNKVIKKHTDLMVPVYDITVDCPTHTFIADGYIVHNSICTTRMVTGSGVPQLSALLDIAPVCREYGIPMISDGGNRHNGNIVKALGAGASSVMLGRMLGGTNESPGKILLRDGKRVKLIRGMAGYMANLSNSKKQGLNEPNMLHAEGGEGYIPCSGPLNEVLTQICHSIRSGFSYSGATHISEMHKKAKFIRLTNNGISESNLHDIIQI